MNDQSVYGYILSKAASGDLQWDDKIYEYICKKINDSGLFDSGFYLNENEDVRKSGLDPLYHYIFHGGSEGRDPSRKFSSSEYMKRHMRTRELQLNPLIEYIFSGKNESYITRKNRVRARKTFAANTKYKIDIVNVNFYDWSGKILYKGGAERYVFDLACSLKDEGHTVRLLQNANHEFTRTYRGIEVVGVVTGAKDATPASMRVMSKEFAKVCKEADIIIASPLDLACELSGGSCVIGINHGIHWDTKRNSLANYRIGAYQEIFDALDNIEVGVCVDTNFLNWVRTYDYTLSQKLRYIPNYYDMNDFVFSEKDFSKELTIMYPRRLYEARGIYFVLDAFNQILKRHSDVNLKLVGQTDDKTVMAAVRKIMKKYPQRVTLEEYAMEDMHMAYKDSHIVLIPTMYAEGTSLSCLEAMATNNALIATNIGGLPNLVMNGFNGRLTEPSTLDLENAVEEMLRDRDSIRMYAQNGGEFVKIFEKNQWNNTWKKVIGALDY